MILQQIRTVLFQPILKNLKNNEKPNIQIGSVIEGTVSSKSSSDYNIFIVKAIKIDGKQYNCALQLKSEEKFVDYSDIIDCKIKFSVESFDAQNVKISYEPIAKSFKIKLVPDDASLENGVAYKIIDSFKENSDIVELIVYSGVAKVKVGEEYCYAKLTASSSELVVITYEKEERYPVKDFREAIKKTVKKEFGIDAAELAKLDTAELPKEMAQSVTELGGLSIKKYLETGKSYRFPMTSEKEATMSLSLTEAEEVTKATNKITEVAPGKYESVPTGKTVKTSAHTRMVAKNAVPGWLKEDVTK